jgi:hypothetical protein
MSTAAQVLVLGLPNAGKTHYGAQLYQRLREGRGKMTLGASPTDLSAFESAFQRLQEGLTAERTATQTYAQLPISVRAGDRQTFELAWPDYGGEQLKALLEFRKIPVAWVNRLNEADRWMLFIRPFLLSASQDIPQRLGARKPALADAPRPPVSAWDDNARLVELLQLLLHAARHSTASRLRVPRLAVMLSCWDELPEQRRQRAPPEVLRSELPLLAAFLEANWEPGACSVWGLSALGKPLDKETSDEEYLDKGPTAFGYVVPPSGGGMSPDLSDPLLWLLQAEE